MTRISSIRQNPPEVVAAINATIQANRHLSLDNLLPLVRARGATCSRSALHRHMRELDAKAAELDSSPQLTVVIVDLRTAATTMVGSRADFATVVAAVEALGGP